MVAVLSINGERKIRHPHAKNKTKMLVLELKMSHIPKNKTLKCKLFRL